MLRPAFRPAFRSALQPALNRVGRSGGGGAPVPSASIRFLATDVSATETGFRIETRIDSSGDPWRVDATLAALAGTGLEIDETLALYLKNTRYNWRIVPFNGSGDGAVYGPYTIITVPSEAPSAFAVAVITHNSVTVTWADPVVLPLDGGMRVVYRLAGDPDWIIGGDIANGVETATFALPDPGEDYELGLYAYNENIAFEDSMSAIVELTATTLLTPPQVVAFTILASGSNATMQLDGAAQIGAGGSGGVVLTMSGGAVTLTYASVVGDLINFTTSRIIATGETGTAAYTQPGNGIENTLGTDLTTFTGKAVVNNVPNYLFRSGFETSTTPPGTSEGWFWESGSGAGGGFTPAIVGSGSLRTGGSSTRLARSVAPTGSMLYVSHLISVTASGYNATALRIRKSSGSVYVAQVTFVNGGGLTIAYGSGSTSVAAAACFGGSGWVVGNVYRVWISHSSASGTTCAVASEKDAWKVVDESEVGSTCGNPPEVTSRMEMVAVPDAVVLFPSTSSGTNYARFDDAMASNAPISTIYSP